MTKVAAKNLISRSDNFEFADAYKLSHKLRRFQLNHFRLWSQSYLHGQGLLLQPVVLTLAETQPNSHGSLF